MTFRGIYVKIIIAEPIQEVFYYCFKVSYDLRKWCPHNYMRWCHLDNLKNLIYNVLSKKGQNQNQKCAVIKRLCLRQ